MKIGADIPLYGHEEIISQILLRARTPGTVVYLASKKSGHDEFSVINFCEENHIPPERVKYYPYYETCKSFPLAKAEFDVWVEKECKVEAVLPGSTNKYVLFCTMFHPFKHEGNSVGMMFWINEFRARGYKVHLLYYMYDNIDDKRLHDQAEAFFDRYIAVPVTASCVGKNKNGLNVHVDEWCGPEVVAAVQTAVNEYPYDVCFTNYTFFTAIFDVCHAYTKKVLYTHDSFTQRNKNMLQQGYPEAGWISLTQEGEALACARSHAIIAPQEAEATFFRSITPDTIPVYMVSPLPKANFLESQRNVNLPIVIGYMGSKNYVNEYNISEFINKIAQKKSISKKVSFVIAGGVSSDIEAFLTENARKNTQYTLLGRIENQVDFFRQCTLIVNPERGGTGIKIKSLDALAHGAALLCTQAGAIGLGSTNKYHNAPNVEAMIFQLEHIERNRSIVSDLRSVSQELLAALREKQKDCINMIIPSDTKIKTDSYVEQHASPYHKDVFSDILQYCTMADKVILEIGPDQHFITARLCILNGAKQVIACTPAANWVLHQNLPNTIVPKFRDFLDADIAPGSVDIVVGVALLEHLDDYEAIFQKINTILRENGKVYLQGGPLWPGPLGHHLWADKDEACGFYSFTGRNPVPHWAHLTLTDCEMKQFLLQEPTLQEPKDAQLIVDAIYHNSPLVGSNKQAVQTLVDSFKRAFVTHEDRNMCSIPQANKYFSKASFFLSQEELCTCSLTLVGRKNKLSHKKDRKNMISVIIPCYNVEKYVSECIDSVLNQTYPEVEIILVDDKSTDDTKKILSKYAVKHKNITLIEHQYNLGLGPARNSGLAQAQGEYIFFLDSDDYLANDDVFKKLHEEMQIHAVEVVGSSFFRLYDHTNRLEIDTHYASAHGFRLTGEEAFKASFQLGETSIALSAWGALILHDVLKRTGITFPPGAHEDLPTIPFVYYAADAVYYSSLPSVVYRVRMGSLSNTPWKSSNCVDSALLWKELQSRVREAHLEKYLPDIACCVLAHNIYKIQQHGLQQEAVQDFLMAATYIMRSITQQTSDAAIAKLVPSLCSTYNLDEKHTVLKQLASYLPSKHLSNFFDGEDPYFHTAPIILHESPNDALHDAIFVDYYAHCPEKTRKFPAMLTEGDRATYFYFAKHSSLEGVTIDTGCFIGGTTSALLEGLRQNPLYDEQQHKLFVYDLFRNDEPYITRWLRDIYGNEKVPDGLEDFSGFFKENMHDDLHAIRLHHGDIVELGYSHKRPIEILGLDCCKALHITDSVIRNFFPYLIPQKSVIIHQDYIHEYHPYIHVSMELLKDYFEPILEVEGGGSYVWRCIKQITPACIEGIFGPLSSIQGGFYPWWHDQWQRNDLLLYKKQTQMKYQVNQACLGMTRAMYKSMLQQKNGATQDAQEMQLIYAHLKYYPENALCQKLGFAIKPAAEARNDQGAALAYILKKESYESAFFQNITYKITDNTQVLKHWVKKIPFATQTYRYAKTFLLPRSKRLLKRYPPLFNFFKKKTQKFPRLYRYLSRHSQ